MAAASDGLVISEHVTVWLTLGVTLVGLTAFLVTRALDAWHRWTADQTAALERHAALAVRHADATYVRPLLRRRLRECLWGAAAGADDRAALYDRLVAHVTLRPAERWTAHTLAFEALVDGLRAARPPVLRLDTEARLRRATPRLRQELERACAARPRPGAAMIAALGDFVAARAPA